MATQQKVKTIYERQFGFQWGMTYCPSIMAVRNEAPRGSRCSQLNSRKLGRSIHLISTHERTFAQLALYHPRLFDLHEQKMLSPAAMSHPLHGHPSAIGMSLGSTSGTVSIADRIGLRHHKVTVECADGQRESTPFPYLGDLLLYLKDESGIPYAINWSVKGSRADFAENERKSVKPLVQQRRDKEKARLRHLLEEEYYREMGIKTIRVSSEDIDPIVAANLSLLYGCHDDDFDLEESLLDDYSCDVELAIDDGVPVSNVALSYGRKWGRRDQFIRKFYKDVWARRLSVDLFSPVLIDHPLQRAERDILDVYAELYKGDEK
ncbi:TPA: hypothetical protein ACPIDV_003944 [Pseudomonas aeruginosa]